MAAKQQSESCGVAHGDGMGESPDRTLVAVFASPVSARLLAYARDLGYHPVLVEPDSERAESAHTNDLEVVAGVPTLDDTADLVVTDHHRPELGVLLRDALAHPARWIGVMGNPRHPGPHVEALESLGVPAADIARVHRPVGLNIGSRTPAEIAVATIAGLIADRNGRPGGFTF